MQISLPFDSRRFRFISLSLRHNSAFELHLGVRWDFADVKGSSLGSLTAMVRGQNLEEMTLACERKLNQAIILANEAAAERKPPEPRASGSRRSEAEAVEELAKLLGI